MHGCLLGITDSYQMGDIVHFFKNTSNHVASHNQPSMPLFLTTYFAGNQLLYLTSVIVSAYQVNIASSKKTATVYMSGQDGHWEQFDTTCSLISAPQWHHTSRSGLS